MVSGAAAVPAALHATSPHTAAGAPTKSACVHPPRHSPAMQRPCASCTQLPLGVVDSAHQKPSELSSGWHRE